MKPEELDCLDMKITQMCCVALSEQRTWPEIEEFNHAALLQFPNVIRPNGSNSDLKTSRWLFFHHPSASRGKVLQCVTWQCDNTVWPLWKLSSDPELLLEPWLHEVRHVSTVAQDGQTKHFLWRETSMFLMFVSSISEEDETVCSLQGTIQPKNFWIWSLSAFYKMNLHCSCWAEVWWARLNLEG